MAKQKQPTPINGATVPIELTSGHTIEVDRSSHVCVVYLGELGQAEDPIAHDADLFLISRKRKGLPGLTLAGGASYVEAGLLADHIATGDERLVRRIESGAVRVYAKVEDLLALPVGQLRDAVIPNTRHGAVLRNMEAAERARPQPRAPILGLLAKRIKAYGDNAPVLLGTIDHIDRNRPQEAANG